MLLACCGSLQQQSVLHDLVASMGGTFAYMFDPSISHLIFGTRTRRPACASLFSVPRLLTPHANGTNAEGRADTSKELRLAKGHKHIKIVSPLWLHAVRTHIGDAPDPGVRTY